MRVRPVRVVLVTAATVLLAVQATTAQQTVRNVGGTTDRIEAVGLANGVVINPDDPTSSLFTVDATGRPTWVPPVSAASSTISSAAGVAATLTINAVFDSSITGDGNAAAIQNTINTAIGVYQSVLTDPITVTIRFSKGGGLGSSASYYANLSYATYLAALKADANSANDATSTSLLPSVATNPVNGSSTINVKLANLRAVGITANPPGGDPDGFITVNTSITSPGSPGTSGQYDLLAVVEHEIDEVLGLGSSLPSIVNSSIFPEDLYRYNQSGGRSFTSNTAATAFFSIDAVALLAEFHNQSTSSGDFGDWRSNPLPPGTPPRVQDAFATPGAHPTLSNVELTALDVIGFDRAAGPTISTQPQSQTITSGQTATMNVVASGASPFTYQWYVGTSGNTSSPIGGATSSSYTTPALTSTTSYWVRVSDANGSTNSNTATMTINVVAPSISLHPQSQTIASGQSASLSVTASGTSLSYQWYVGTSGNTSSPIGGASSSSYATASLTSTTRYWVRVSNSAGTANSNTATISIAFTDSLLTAGSSVIKAVHITELRTRINAIRAAQGLPAFSYIDIALTAGSTMIKAVHVTDLRTALAQAYVAAGMAAPTYTDPSLVGVTVKVAHIAELRAAVVAVE